MSLINFLLGRQWVSSLGAQGCGEVFKTIRPKDSEIMEVSFGMGAKNGIRMGQHCYFYLPDGTYADHGTVVMVEPGHAAVNLPRNTTVTSGHVAYPVPASVLLPDEIPQAAPHNPAAHSLAPHRPAPFRPGPFRPSTAKAAPTAGPDTTLITPPVKPSSTEHSTEKTA